MENKWIRETLSREPEEFERVNNTTFMHRINIEKIEDPSEDGENIMISYICDAKAISIDEYQEIMGRRDEIRKIVLETTNTAAYEDGYQAAMILLGGEE